MAAVVFVSGEPLANEPLVKELLFSPSTCVGARECLIALATCVDLFLQVDADVVSGQVRLTNKRLSASRLQTDVGFLSVIVVGQKMLLVVILTLESLI